MAAHMIQQPAKSNHNVAPQFAIVAREIVSHLGHELQSIKNTVFDACQSIEA